MSCLCPVPYGIGHFFWPWRFRCTERVQADVVQAMSDESRKAAGPLYGRRIVVTRARDQAAELGQLLEAAGAVVEHCPAIRIAGPADPGPLRCALRELGSYDWLVLTSVNGVRGFFQEFERAGLEAAVLRRLSVACVGPATAGALREHGVEPGLMPEVFVGSALGSALVAAGARGRVLLARAREADRVWPEALRAAGLEVDDVEVYRTVADEEGLAQARSVMNGGAVDLVLFTSPSTATFFAEAVGTALERVALGAIGPVTAARIRQLGYEPALVAEEHTVSGLVAAVGAYFAPSPGSGDSTRKST